MSGATAPIAAGPRTLPSGWRWAALGNICDIVIGRTPRRDSPEYWNGSLPWVSISDLNDDVLTDTRERITTLGAEASGARLLASGTLLFSFKLTIGKMAVAGVDLFTNEAIAGLVPKADVQLSTEYLRHALSAVNVSSGSSHAVKGRTLNLPLLRAITIPLAPLREQKRIAAALREQLSAAARMRAAAEQQEACVRELTSIVVNRAFEAPAVEWPLRPIGEMARILSGYAFKSAWFSEHGVRLLRNANVSQGSIDWTDTVFLPEDRRSDFGEYELSAGDIVLALDRPMVADGLKVARLAKGDVPSLLLQRVATFRLSDALDAGYLYAFLRTRAFAGAISGHEQSLGVPHVSPKQVSAVVLPVPPIARQRDIVRTLDDALCSVSSASAAVGDQAAESRRLPESLLRRAFSPTVDPAKNVDPSHVDGGSRVGPHPG